MGKELGPWGLDRVRGGGLRPLVEREPGRTEEGCVALDTGRRAAGEQASV